MSDHQCFSVSATAYMHNFNREADGEVYAVHYEGAPRKNEDGTTSFSMIMPALIVSGYIAEPEKIAQRVADILNKHWDDAA